ncbi:hypothetical protein SCA6_016446 [Theobroma cacao]
MLAHVVQMFPNDVYLGDIIDAAKSFRVPSDLIMIIDFHGNESMRANAIGSCVVLNHGGGCAR